MCASWYVTASSYYYATPINVSVGANLLGQMSWIGSTGQWYINCQNNNTGGASLLSVSKNIKETGAYLALEAYNIASCNEYPASGSTTFTNLGVQAGVTASWVGKVLINDGCGEAVHVHESTQSVTLDY